MNLLMVKTNDELASCAAKLTSEALGLAVQEFGEASWVLSGGATPRLSYQVIADTYSSYLDWQKVWFLIGDERHVSVNDPDSNWGAIEKSLLVRLKVNPDHKIAPVYHEDINEMAENYALALNKLPKTGAGVPRLDLVWLGLGDDGHTLSLFPGHNLITDGLVVAVTASPKPPEKRISLSLLALEKTRGCIILAVGRDKAEAVAGLVKGDLSLPITRAVKAIEDNSGKVCLITDTAAGSKL